MLATVTDIGLNPTNGWSTLVSPLTSEAVTVASTHLEVSVAVRHTNACIPGQRTLLLGILKLKTQGSPDLGDGVCVVCKVTALPKYP